MAQPYNCQNNLAHRDPAHGEEAYGHGNGQTERKCQLGFDCHGTLLHIAFQMIFIKTGI